MAERNLGARQQPGDGDADGKADADGQRPDEQRVAERGEQAGPLKGVHPVLDSPAARLDEPIGGGVEAVDQEQQHRPDEKIAERDQDHGHDEMALGQTRRGDAAARRSSWSMVGDWSTGDYIVQAVPIVQSLRSVRSDLIRNGLNDLNDWNVLNSSKLFLSRFPDFEDPLLRFFLLRAHAGFGVGERVLFARLALLVG